MSKKLYMVLSIFIFYGIVIKSDQNQYLIDNIDNQTTDKILIKAEQLAIPFEEVESMMLHIEDLHKLNELLEKHNNDITSVKNDSQFKKIKSNLKQTYTMLISMPFNVLMLKSTLDNLRVKAVDIMTKKAGISGFEELNEDVQELIDETFLYGDKFIKFLRKFSQHFTENKIVKELLES